MAHLQQGTFTVQPSKAQQIVGRAWEMGALVRFDADDKVTIAAPSDVFRNVRSAIEAINDPESHAQRTGPVGPPVVPQAHAPHAETTLEASQSVVGTTREGQQHFNQPEVAPANPPRIGVPPRPPQAPVPPQAPQH